MFGGFLLFHDLTGHALLDIFANPRFDALVFFFGNFFSHFSVGRIPTQDVRVEHGHGNKGNRHDASQNGIIAPAHGREHHIKDEAPNGIE